MFYATPSITRADSRPSFPHTPEPHEAENSYAPGPEYLEDDEEDSEWDDRWRRELKRLSEIHKDDESHWSHYDTVLSEIKYQPLVRHIDPAKLSNDRPPFLKELHRIQLMLLDCYSTVGAKNHRTFLPRLYEKHIDRYRRKGASDLLDDIYQDLIKFGPPLRMLRDMVWFRYGSGAEKDLVGKVLNRVQKIRDWVDDMRMVEITFGTSELIEDYETGRLSFQKAQSSY
ncbi:hypothetical protein VNI00_016999 [Paramarasmius palmivorus]|uniref:Uncharacterized protein n=1 Tax=Paramarasmius palmivorus TaxID=297713 RepID=A0AAW0B9R1_9AGAR